MGTEKECSGTQHNSVDHGVTSLPDTVASTLPDDKPPVEVNKRRLYGSHSDPAPMSSTRCLRSSPYGLSRLELPTVSPYDTHGIPAAARKLRLHFVHSGAPRAAEAYLDARTLFADNFPCNLAESFVDADIIVSLGGDGFLLETLRAHPSVPVYGINCGHIGFLSNAFRDKTRLMGLLREVENANQMRLPFLQLKVDDGDAHFALNEVVVSRSTMQAANVSISINGQVAVPFLAGDGVLVSTPAGSTAYNLSAGGSILPLDAPLLALTPICPFRPRRMESVLLNLKDVVVIKSLGGTEKRPVHAAYDGVELPRSATTIEVRLSDQFGTLLLDNSSKHRIFMERFKPDADEKNDR